MWSPPAPSAALPAGLGAGAPPSGVGSLPETPEIAVWGSRCRAQKPRNATEARGPRRMTLKAAEDARSPPGGSVGPYPEEEVQWLKSPTPPPPEQAGLEFMPWHLAASRGIGSLNEYRKSFCKLGFLGVTRTSKSGVLNLDLLDIPG